MVGQKVVHDATIVVIDIMTDAAATVRRRISCCTRMCILHLHAVTFILVICGTVVGILVLI